MKDFTIIYTEDKEWGDYLICNHCGKKVERGIFSVSHHWVRCLKRKQGLIASKKKNEK